ncbi:MAG: serine/threonine-protein kinase, partial [Calothrix sp. MO_167.B42]|nr:serine/threonine-protein kinase [Calothrix sp. MO_167.B42]
MNYANENVEAKLYDGRYKIIRELGRGGFGVTYLASDLKSGNSHCVLKKLNPQLADVTTAKKLFYREAKVLERLQNTHQIPQFIGYFEEQGNLYIVEEYVEGIPLDRMTSSRWSREDIIYFLYQILSILGIIHEQNIVHRDIKPSNIIKRRENGQLVLIDFGAVKQLEQDQLTPHQQKQTHPTLIISRGYSPPEQIEGEVGFHCDIYALGITAIQLMTGKHPVDLLRDKNDNIIFS